jgi:hypothetical protein
VPNESQKNVEKRLGHKMKTRQRASGKGRSGRKEGTTYAARVSLDEQGDGEEEREEEEDGLHLGVVCGTIFSSLPDLFWVVGARMIGAWTANRTMLCLINQTTPSKPADRLFYPRFIPE